MSQEIVKTQYVISLRNGMVAYIVADDLAMIAAALQANKFFNTKEAMLVNTADIVAIMSPSEYEDQKKYIRGWYKGYNGMKWYNKKGEYEEDTDLGEQYRRAEKKIEEVITKEDAIAFVEKLKKSSARSLLERYKATHIQKIVDLAEIKDYQPIYIP